MDEPPFALVCGWRYPLLIIAKGGSFSTVSTLRLYSSTSIACGFLYEKEAVDYGLIDDLKPGQGVKCSLFFG